MQSNKKWLEALHLCGSIASITGISLLFIRDKIPNAESIGYIFATLFTCSFALGISATIYMLVKVIHPRIPHGWKIAVYGIGLPFLISSGLFLILVIYALAFEVVLPIFSHLSPLP